MVEHMWLAYVDESGNTGHRLDDPDQPNHILVAVCVREDVVPAVAAHIDGVVQRHLGTSERSRATELHAAELKAGKGPWAGFDPSTRVAAFSDALAPLSWDGVLVAHATIDKRRLAQRGDGRAPHLWALQFLIEKLNAFLRHRDERALLVADQTNEHEQFALDLLVDLQTGRPRPGLDLGDMTNIIDTVHFVRSETNRGVQLADLVAYLLNRIQHPDRRAATERALWNQHVAPNRRTWREPWP